LSRLIETDDLSDECLNKTISIFNRYNITNGDDMREAIRRTQEYRASVREETNLLQFKQEPASR
jgi:hypothetical protein